MGWTCSHEGEKNIKKFIGETFSKMFPGKNNKQIG